MSLRAARTKNPSPDSPPLNISSLQTGSGSQFQGATVVKVFAALAALTFLLRIFYAGHLYQDDGLWFTSAEELMRGKALYREIYFDKPPALPLVYAGLFKIFGPHILTIRLFTIFYSLAVSFVLYLFGAWLYERRTGLIAAALFAVFSTTYQEGHFQGFNTDFLMALPYTAGVYLLARSQGAMFGPVVARAQSLRFAFIGGALIGIAFQTNPKAAFALLFFAALLLIARRTVVSSQWSVAGDKTESRGQKAEGKSMTSNEPDSGRQTASGKLTAAFCALAGFAAGALPFWIYIAATHSLSEYWLYVWDWGSRYARYYGARAIAASALRQSVDYFALNNTLLVALAFVAVSTIRRAKANRSEAAKLALGADSVTASEFRADLTLLLWFAVSYAGLAVGGRFFGHYFFQILPSLCLIGARGLVSINESLKAQSDSSSKPRWLRAFSNRRALFAALAIGFAVTIVRFHSRTVTLAVDWARGTKSDATREWFHEILNREERMVAAGIKDMPDGAADRVGVEAMRVAEKVKRADEQSASSDYLFVWGYRPEIYFWTDLKPASRYLSTQPLTGVPADVHYFGDGYHPILDENVTAAARLQLLRDLEQTRPEYIVDELGAFNAALSIKSFPELAGFMEEYKPLGMIERFMIYRRKEFTKGRRRRNAEP
ncbi:MAG TPA: glycosyltransferase family 39 protein [Blastocatellia bacterium]|nr:glycosyltransferase family 39 protein [Blastocatellia bacterium]